MYTKWFVCKYTKVIVLYKDTKVVESFSEPHVNVIYKRIVLVLEPRQEKYGL